MSISYSFSLCYGFEIPKEEVLAPFKRTKKDEGEFHMEDRFDPKTGEKKTPVKVWDRKPSEEHWYEIDGKTYEDLDPEDWDKILKKKFSCNVEVFGSFWSGDLTEVFYVNDSPSWKEAEDLGNISVYNSAISSSQLEELIPKAKELKRKLEAAGYKVEEPKIFIATRIT